MKSEQLKKCYGDEYPAVVVMNGVRMSMRRERRFSRSYSSLDLKMFTEVSRFMDGSASITLTQLEFEWPGWHKDERRDFCGASRWLYQQADYGDILRYIMRHGGPDDWSAIAGCVGTYLPQVDAFDLLTRAHRSIDLKWACNIVQGIALTKHPDGERVLLAHLAALWVHGSLWLDDDFTNWFAYGATCCIGHLIDLGAPPEDFASHVRELARHPCAGNRVSCRRFLAKHFPWLSDQTDATCST